MKIIKILTELDFGGVEKVTQLTALGMRVYPEVELEIWALGKGGKVAEELKESGVQIKVWNRNPRIPNWNLMVDLKKALNTYKPDIVHTAGAEANFHGLFAARLAKVPVRIGEEIGFPNHHKAWEWIFKGVYSTAHKVIAISNAVKEYIGNKGEVRPEKVAVIYNPAQLQNAVLNGEAVKQPFRFVMISRLTAIKNIAAVLKSLANIIHGAPYEPKLLIIGDGEERDSLEELVRKLDIVENVKFLGFQADVSPFLFQSDVFLIPSYSEGSSVALAEAMMAGLPSVITKVGGASEIIGESNSAKLIDPHNPQSIENAMLQFLQMPEKERLEMGIRAQKEAHKYSVENHIKSLLSLYHSLLESKK
ncbi:glycosyltransferase [Echinicola shivajiensis]|uniref:glycosyltransferase n=1 Tax=Echinicola shivajiensis TaxID=1035916 RepID=UPI001BFC8920|nr:glycosyltransferase [Echinicola shivajiensis]